MADPDLELRGGGGGGASPRSATVPFHACFAFYLPSALKLSSAISVAIFKFALLFAFRVAVRFAEYIALHFSLSSLMRIVNRLIFMGQKTERRRKM